MGIRCGDDARLTAVEGEVTQLKKNQSSFKWYGDTRLRYARRTHVQLLIASLAYKRGCCRCSAAVLFCLKLFILIDKMSAAEIEYP